MIKTGLKLLLAVPAIAWAAFGLYIALGGFAIPDHTRGLTWLAAALVLVLVSLVGCIFRGTRRVAMASLLILVISVFAELGLRSHRRTVGVRQLEAIYLDIASRGQPFPQSIDRASYANPTVLQWYYQKNSEQSFAIVYIESSDGWAMEYPEGTWRFIGYRPGGYDPNKAAASDAD